MRRARRRALCCAICHPGAVGAGQTPLRVRWCCRRACGHRWTCRGPCQRHSHFDCQSDASRAARNKRTCERMSRAFAHGYFYHFLGSEALQDRSLQDNLRIHTMTKAIKGIAVVAAYDCSKVPGRCRCSNSNSNSQPTASVTIQHTEHIAVAVCKHDDVLHHHPSLRQCISNTPASYRRNLYVLNVSRMVSAPKTCRVSKGMASAASRVLCSFHRFVTCDVPK